MDFKIPISLPVKKEIINNNVKVPYTFTLKEHGFSIIIPHSKLVQDETNNSCLDEFRVTDRKIYTLKVRN